MFQYGAFKALKIDHHAIQRFYAKIHNALHSTQDFPFNLFVRVEHSNNSLSKPVFLVASKSIFSKGRNSLKVVPATFLLVCF